MCAQWRQISLGIRPVWSESSLSALWVKEDPSFLHADSESMIRVGACPGWYEYSLGADAILKVLHFVSLTLCCFVLLLFCCCFLFFCFLLLFFFFFFFFFSYEAICFSLALCYFFHVFSALLAVQLPRLGKKELISLFFVRFSDLRLFGFVCFLFLLVSGKGCGLWLWHYLVFSLSFFFVMRWLIF